jgi:hypothetical protein
MIASLTTHQNFGKKIKKSTDMDEANILFLLAPKSKLEPIKNPPKKKVK